MVPQTQKQWVVRGSNGFDSLELQTGCPIPSIGDLDVLVQSKYYHPRLTVASCYLSLTQFYYR